MARQKTALVVPPEAEGINTGASAEMLADGRKALAQVSKEDMTQLCELAADVGAIRAFEFTRNLVAAATIKVFERVCESKQIKHLPIRTADGVATATNLDDFCKLAFGKSRTVMFEASASLHALGEEAYEQASRLGLNRNALRAARALPPEKLESVRLAIASGNTKAEVMSVIEDLAQKVEQTESELAEAKAEKAASDELLVNKNARIDKLERKIKHFDRLPPDQKLAELQQAATAVATEATGLIAGTLRQAVLSVQKHCAEPDEQAHFLAGLVAQVQAVLSSLREEFRLADTSTAEDKLKAGAREAIRLARGAGGGK